MARYRKVDCRIWNDAKFNALSERGKLVFLFLLTHPNLTMLGAMRATEAGLASELGVTIEAFAEAFRQVLAKGIIRHDPGRSFVWLPNFLRYNRPESPNVVRAWPEAFDLIPECALKYQLFQKLKDFIEGLSEGFREAFAEAFAKGMPNQEQEQEQEQEPEQSINCTTNVGGGKGLRRASQAKRAAGDQAPVESPPHFDWDEAVALRPKILAMIDRRKAGGTSTAEIAKEIGIGAGGLNRYRGTANATSDVIQNWFWCQQRHSKHQGAIQ